LKGLFDVTDSLGGGGCKSAGDHVVDGEGGIICCIVSSQITNSGGVTSRVCLLENDGWGGEAGGG